MTAGQLYKFDILMREFGASRVFETAKRFREISDKAKIRNQEVSIVDIATFLYLLSSTEGPKDTYLAEARLFSFYSEGDDDGKEMAILTLAAYIKTPDLIEKRNLKKIEVSTYSGESVFHHDGKEELFWDDLNPKGREKKLIEHFTVIKPEILREINQAYQELKVQN